MFSAATLTPCKGLVSDCATPIIIDNYKVQDVTLEAAIEAVRVKTGVNIILKGVPPEKRLKKVSLDLHDVPLTFIIESLCKLSDLRMKVEPLAFVIEPKDAPSPMQTRIYRVPPNFPRTGISK